MNDLKVTCPTFEAMGQIPVFHRTYFLLIQQTVQGVIVQYRLALYSIPIGLLNTMQACKVVELFLLATIGLLNCLVEHYSSVDWSVSFSVMWSNSFTIGRNSVVYKSAPVVNLRRRLFPVVNAVEGRRSVCRTPAGFSLNPISDESLDPDDHTVRICFPQLFRMSSSNVFLSSFLADVRVTFSLN